MGADLMKVELEIVAEGLGFPEGPVVLRDGTLFFVDIRDQVLMRLDPGASAAEVVASIPGGPNGLAIGPDGFGYVCNNGGVFDFDPTTREPRPPLITPDPKCPGQDYGKAIFGAAGQMQDGLPKPAGSIQRVNLKTGAVSEVYGPTTGHELIAPDDIVFDAHGPQGSFWFTDCGYQNETMIRKGGVYAAHVDGLYLQHMAAIPSPNGIGFSKDGRVLYVADTLFGRLWALAVSTVEDGKGKPVLHAKSRTIKPIAGDPFPGDVILNLPGLQWLDSLKVEDGGKICIGTLLSGGITVFDPVTKEHEFLAVGQPTPMSAGDPFTSNLCFGGDDMTEVWITASAEGRIYHGRWPRPGLKLAFND